MLQNKKNNVNASSLEYEKYIAGIQTRTKNTDELSGKGKLAALWEQFFNDQISEQLKEKISNDIYVVYSNYASDENGEYDYLIGFEVKPEDASKWDQSKIKMEKIEIGHYSKITTEKGSMPKVLVDAWHKIWNMTSKDLGGIRAFKTDFEVYSSHAMDPNDSIVDIYLGLK